MGRRAGWPLGLIVAAWLPGQAAQAVEIASARPERWNVLLITLDTTRRDHVSGYGADPRLTPHLAALAAEGCRFVNAYSLGNSTNLSHAGLMTGLPAIQTGVFDNTFGLPAEAVDLAQLFRDAGYHTAGFPAAVHLGRPMHWRGFQKIVRPPTELRADDVTDFFCRWIDQGRDTTRPFFAWVHYFDPHVLYDPPADLRERFYKGDPRAGDGPLLAQHDFIRNWDFQMIHKWLDGVRDPAYPRAMYAAEVCSMDRELGRLLDALRAAQLWERTAVWVVADHGESLGEHDVLFDHLGLYETQLHVPMLVRMPGFPRGIAPTDAVWHLDVLPTLVELFGLRAEQQGPGVSLLPLLLGKPCAATQRRAYMIHESPLNEQVAVRQRDWKLIWPVGVSPRLPAAPQLFNLRDDPNELKNLAEQEPLRVREMRSLAGRWINLGVVKPGTDLRSEDREKLRSLGYTSP